MFTPALNKGRCVLTFKICSWYDVACRSVHVQSAGLEISKVEGFIPVLATSSLLQRLETFACWTDSLWGMCRCKMEWMEVVAIVICAPEFNSSAAFLNSQLVSLLPDGIWTVLCSYIAFVSSFVSNGPKKTLLGSGQFKILSLYKSFTCSNLVAWSRKEQWKTTRQWGGVGGGGCKNWKKTWKVPVCITVSSSCHFLDAPF